MVSRSEWAQRPRRESLSKRLGRVAKLIAARDQFRCVYCKRTAEETGAPLHLDHLKPRSHGGEDSPTNLVLACRSHNSSRQTRSVREFAREIGVQPRAIWAQARRKLPDAPTLRLVKAASPPVGLATCTAPLPSGRICPEPAVAEEMVEGVLCPLCATHAQELRHEQFEGMRMAASPSYVVRSRSGRVLGRFARRTQAEAFVRRQSKKEG